MRGRTWVFIMALAMTVVASSGACPAEMVALVLEVKGASVQGITPYTELAVGQQVELPHGATIVFLHYIACRTVTVAGGSITMGAKSYTATDGTEKSSVPPPCPRQVTPRVRGEVAAPVLQHYPVNPRILQVIPHGSAHQWSTQPSFVLVGASADAFHRVRVAEVREGRPVLVLEALLEGRRFLWPAGATPLRVGNLYWLVLLPRNNAGVQPAAELFRAEAPTRNPADEALILIRLDEERPLHRR
jgi:hypothetical protein